MAPVGDGLRVQGDGTVVALAEPAGDARGVHRGGLVAAEREGLGGAHVGVEPGQGVMELGAAGEALVAQGDGLRHVCQGLGHVGGRRLGVNVGGQGGVGEHVGATGRVKGNVLLAGVRLGGCPCRVGDKPLQLGLVGCDGALHLEVARARKAERPRPGTLGREGLGRHGLAVAGEAGLVGRDREVKAVAGHAEGVGGERALGQRGGVRARHERDVLAVQAGLGHEDVAEDGNAAQVDGGGHANDGDGHHPGAAAATPGRLCLGVLLR